MADVITRLKLESQDYDSKIKRATQGLLQMEQECRKVGGTLSILEKDQKEYISSLGRMDTVSKTVRGRLSELNNAFVELRAQYNRLTQEEKNGDFGKALASSLEQLKQRIRESKNELQGIDAELKNNSESAAQNGMSISDLTSKLGINIKSLVGWGAALTASKVALDVTKDALLASEATVDEWGRTTDACKSLYEGFLTALNTGDISGYLDNMNAIVQAARQAYDELDRLGTMRTIQSPQMSAQQTENNRLRMMLQTGRYIAPIDGRTPTMADGQKLTNAQMQTIERQLRNGMKTVTTLVGNEVKQTNKAIVAVYNRQSKELGMSLSEFRKGTSSMAEFDKRMAGYQKYVEWNSQAGAKFAKQGGRGSVNFDRNNPYAEYRKWGVFRVDGERYNSLVQLIQQRDQQAAQAYQTQGQMYRTINRADNRINAGGGAGGGGRTGGKTGVEKEVFPEGSMKYLQQSLQELRKAQDLATNPEAWNEYQVQIDEVNEKIKALKSTYTEASEAAKKLAEYQKAQEDYNDALASGNFSDILKAQEALNKLRGSVNLPDGNGVTVMGNQNTGISGAFEKSNISQASISGFISAIKSELDKADLGSQVYDKLTEKLNDATIMSNVLKELITNGVNGIDLEEVGTLLKEKMLKGDITDEEWKELEEQINAKLAELGIDPIEIDVKTGNVKQAEKDADNMAKNWQKASYAVGAVGNAMSQIEDPAAKVMGTLAQAVATVALGYAQATKQASSMGPWAWIAFAATGLATMITTISTIKSTAKFSEGGVIHGNSYSGDNIGGLVDGSQLVGLNSGEVVLNHAQQNNLANELEGNRQGEMQSAPYVMGEQIYLGVNTFLRRTGRGELVTTKG